MADPADLGSFADEAHAAAGLLPDFMKHVMRRANLRHELPLLES